MPFAKQTYLELEKILDISIFQERSILRALQNTFEQNEWDRRSSFEENIPYFKEAYDLGNYSGHINKAFAWGEITGAAKLDMPLLIDAFREYLASIDMLIEEEFEFNLLNTKATSISYKNQDYSKIVFCEGAKVSSNPFFGDLPHTHTKGESLLIRIKKLNVKNILKNRLHLVPIKEDLFWVGSTNSFTFSNVYPSDEMKNHLIAILKEFLKVPFEIVEHNAGIRPTVSDKRPLLGKHQELDNLFIFNGLGTKGASLGPFFADQMAKFILYGKPIDSEVDIQRFSQNP